MISPKRIFLSPPHMSGLEQQFVKEAFDSNYIAPLGPQVDAFEQEFAKEVDVKYALAVSSGTAAIHLALIHLGIQTGDEVFVSTFTFAASVNPIVYQKAKPIFIDSEPSSWNMDPGLLEKALNNRARKGKLPKAVIVVHLYGQCADMDSILEMCDRFEVPVIEDAAEALGASYKERAAGTMGYAGIFSFNGNKIITTSGGGMLVSNDVNFIEHVRKLSTQARDPAPHYQHSEIGYNYRMSNILAAIGRGQLKILYDRVRRKREIFNFYQKALADLPGIDFMPEAPWGRHSRWLTTLIIDPEKFGASREKIRVALEKENIESRPLWKPMHLQPVFNECEVVGGSVSERLFEHGLCLPSGTAMREEDLQRIIAIIKSFT